MTRPSSLTGVSFGGYRCLWVLHRRPHISQFVVESVLHGGPDDRPLPVVVYLDDIAMYGDTQEQVLKDTLEAVKRLAAAGFMLNLHKSQLVQAVGIGSRASLDLGWLLGAQHHQARHFDREDGW